MKFITLERKFIEWDRETHPDLEAWRPTGVAGGWMNWDDILASKRAVILAEGGSGKSTEFRERHRMLNAEGKFTFLLTVKKAGDKGLEDSFTSKNRLRFTEWRASDQPAWIFVDSIDEAKAAGVPLADALAHVAEAIEGAELRAHVIFSGRPSEWEYRKDLHAVMELLSPPSLPSKPAAIDMDELVIKAIQRDRQVPEPSPDKVLIAVMAPLDNGQVEAFARVSEIRDVSQFLAALDTSNLWPFARRPSDLDWLVHYWRGHRKFSSFEKMLEAHLVERLTEANPDRARNVHLDRELAMRALERIGAAMVLGRIQDVEIVDSASGAAQLDGLRLSDALPDVPPAMQRDLLNAAIFVPASAGLARLQSDNDGVVRSYLAARWLHRMLANNCPWRTAHDLLFAETYGVATVKPSMAAVAAWLSLWNPRVADELAKRQPLALVEHGDPSSLPALTRRVSLRGIVNSLEVEDSLPLFHHDGLMRFATPDIEEEIKTLWKEQSNANTHAEVPRQLLLRMIAEGNLHGCAPIAFGAGVEPSVDTLTRALAVQAIAEAGDDAMRSRYGKFLRREFNQLDATFLWTAVNLLFPVSVTVDDLIAMLPKLLDGELTTSQGIDFYGPKLGPNINRLDDAVRLLTALLDKLPQSPTQIAEVEHESVAPLMPTIASLADRVLDLDISPEPNELVIDASLRLTALNWRHGWREQALTELANRLRSTPERRRATLWRLCQTHAALDPASREPLSDVWQLRATRFDLGAGLGDVEWLLRDARLRERRNERLLALHLAMAVWLQNGKPDGLLRDAKAVAGGLNELEDAIEAWINPPPPSAQQIRLDESHATYEATSREREEKRIASWISFAADIRKNPAQLDTLRPPDSEGVDARLYHIWQLLEGLSRNSHGKTMSDVNLLKPIFGIEALSHIRHAFIRYWRLGDLKLRSERPPEDANAVLTMERLGLVGVSIEAASVPAWPNSLTDKEAELATVYATLELNRFPTWFGDLAASKPAPVRETLRRAFAPEMNMAFAGDRREVLERIASSSDAIAALFSNDMIDRIASWEPLPTALLRLALRIARRGGQDRQGLLQIALSKAFEQSEPTRIAAYLSCAFSIDGDAATNALLAISEPLEAAELTELAKALLPSIMDTGWGFGHDNDVAPVLSTESLTKLTRFAFNTVRPEDDNDRANGKVYSPDLRDNAESARGILFKQLADRPGATTFEVLRQLSGDRSFPMRKRWLARLARARAENDSESAPWTPQDVKAFEEDFDTAPRTPQDLQRVAAARIEDLQHQLVHSDFGQGLQVMRLPHEVDVQRWIAAELKARQGRSYTLEREPHVADEKEPDIRLSSNYADARLPIEIKVAESWGLQELVEALTVQLAGRYLRNNNGRWGILLLVHQRKRRFGWKLHPGKFLSFQEMVEHLQKLAETLSASSSVGPQLQVCAIDVSSIKAPSTTKKSSTRAKGNISKGLKSAS